MDEIIKKIKMIFKKLTLLRKQLVNHNLDGYIVPKNDEFFGEYVKKGNDRLKYISGFTGSAGFSVILRKKAYLFVDGRYTIQANIESGKIFTIVEIHKKKPNFILTKFSKELKLGFDPKIFNETSLLYNFKSSKIKLVQINKNLIDVIWNNKPKINYKKFYILNSKNVGQNYKDKIKLINNFLKRKKIKNLLITAPENIAWLLNIRGYDSNFSPIPNCQAIINYQKKIFLIVDKRKINKKFINYFNNSIRIINPNTVKPYLNSLSKHETFSIDKMTCSIFYKNEIKKRFRFYETIDPIYFLKAKKNNVEINNMINSHKEDGVALTKFLYWLKSNVIKRNISELDAQSKLEQFRKKNKNYIFSSFNTIAGTGPNGAIVHYRATKKSNRIIKKKDIFLCDSGGQYKYGTTDVTRTVCFTKPEKKIKDIFTMVLKGHIGVATFNLNKNTTGNKIDKVARAPLKSKGKDYAHGTGHGVGHFLNVHEGPHSISKFNKVKFSEGMIVSNEPGYYKKNKFGIRIENLVYVKKLNNKIFFENLTLAPIDKDLINFDLLTKKEFNYLNDYNKKIYQSLNPYLKKKEKNWLKSFIN